MSNTAWFRDWFESEDYLLIYKHRNKEEAALLVRLVTGTLRLAENSQILDLACGFGRHSILFGENGYSVTGLDLSSTLLKIARHDAESRGVKLSLVRGDIREEVFRPGFDLVSNFFTSWGYFSDRENFDIFRLIAGYLKSGGYFVFDYFNKEYLLKNLVPESEEVHQDITISQKRYFTGDSVKKVIRIIKEDSVKEFEESVKLYDPGLIIDKLTATGFKIRNQFGNYNGEMYDVNNSPRLILICQKEY